MSNGCLLVIVVSLCPVADSAILNYKSLTRITNNLEVSGRISQNAASCCLSTNASAICSVKFCASAGTSPSYSSPVPCLCNSGFSGAACACSDNFFASAAIRAYLPFNSVTLGNDTYSNWNCTWNGAIAGLSSAQSYNSRSLNVLLGDAALTALACTSTAFLNAWKTYSAVSFSFWVYPFAPTASAQYVIDISNAANTDSMQLTYRITSMTWDCRSSGALYSISAPLTPAPGNLWYHLVLTKYAGIGMMVVNGGQFLATLDLKGTNCTNPSRLSPPTNFRIFAGGLLGYLSNVRVYAADLTLDTARKIYQCDAA
eukprot:NODE_869_length_1122_cov_201.643989_g708_i0.p1 GENE.NODE_869_length_1122_cov_201.643989_g708_i0~~NODE_869_length_1122_cov_201.643989_g708_i0.p1  ORF type:complete len:314 (-),score=10.44 NODE_869_length_1122_cov_201.643989_g708_i0:104-1045(-)